MLTTFSIVSPVFALILAGWVARRLGVLGLHATTELNRFVAFLALPALLFDITAHAHWRDIWQPGFIAAFGLANLLIFGAILLLRLRGCPLADAAIDGLNAAYGNTGYIGFPLAMVAFGAAAMPLALTAAMITICFTFALAIIFIEIDLQSEQRPAHLVMKVGGTLMRNPLLVAPVLGACFPLTGVSPPASADTFLKLLGGAASPCALVALGLFLAEPRQPAARDRKVMVALVLTKLIAQPVLAFVLAGPVFGLSPLSTQVAVLFAALPTGTGSFMLAKVYEREVGTISDVVLVSTIVSVGTLSLYLAAIAPVSAP